MVSQSTVLRWWINRLGKNSISGENEVNLPTTIKKGSIIFVVGKSPIDIMEPIFV